MFHYAGCFIGILITANFNLYITGWHIPQCLYIRFVYIYITYNPTNQDIEFIKGVIIWHQPKLHTPLPKEIPSNLTIHVLLVWSPSKMRAPIEFHPTITLPSTPAPMACPAITRLLITSAGVAQIEATKPLQQALRVWTAVPYFWSAFWWWGGYGVDGRFLFGSNDDP